MRVTHDPGFEWGFQLSAVQLLPVDVAEEDVGSHGILPPLCGHAAQTSSRVLGQELKRWQKHQIHTKTHTTHNYCTLEQWFPTLVLREHLSCMF